MVGSRAEFKRQLDEALESSLSEQNDPEKMCGQNLEDCVIDDKNEYFSIVDPDGVNWKIMQCLYCKRAFLNKS
jgi:hypothetical protein